MRRKILTELPKHLRNRQSQIKLSNTIRYYVPYLTHTTMNKNFHRLALLCKISYITEFKNNSSFISA